MGGIEGVGFVSTKYVNASHDYPDLAFHFISGTINSDGGRQVRKIHNLNERVSTGGAGDR